MSAQPVYIVDRPHWFIEILKVIGEMVFVFVGMGLGLCYAIGKAIAFLLQRR